VVVIQARITHPRPPNIDKTPRAEPVNCSGRIRLANAGRPGNTPEKPKPVSARKIPEVMPDVNRESNRKTAAGKNR